jgi:hypothetical protein
MLLMDGGEEVVIRYGEYYTEGDESYSRWVKEREGACRISLVMVGSKKESGEVLRRRFLTGRW